MSKGREELFSWGVEEDVSSIYQMPGINPAIRHSVTKVTIRVWKMQPQHFGGEPQVNIHRILRDSYRDRRSDCLDTIP